MAPEHTVLMCALSSSMFETICKQRAICNSILGNSAFNVVPMTSMKTADNISDNMA